MESRASAAAAIKQRHLRGDLDLFALLAAGNIHYEYYTSHEYDSMFENAAGHSAPGAHFPFGGPRNLCYNRAAAEESRSWRATVEILAKRFYVSGEVQGVGFRFFAERVAARLDVSGYVKNLFDGRVEVYAIGSAAQLEALKNELRRGPRMASRGSCKGSRGGDPARILGWVHD